MKDAIAVVIKRDDTFLLIKRAKKDIAEDYWCPITGAVEKDERQEQAATREAQEEMGMIVKPIEKVWECITEDRHYRLHWWYVKLLNDKITMNRDEVKEYRWVTSTQMQSMKMFKADLRFFKKIGDRLGNSTG